MLQAVMQVWDDMSYSLNSLEGGSIRDYREYYRGYEGGYYRKLLTWDHIWSSGASGEVGAQGLG